MKQKFGEEKLTDALRRFQQEQKGAKGQGTFERFMQNMGANAPLMHDKILISPVFRGVGEEMARL